MRSFFLLLFIFTQSVLFENLIILKVKTDEKDDSSLPYYKRMHSSSTGFSLKPWHSRENTYLQIYPDSSNKDKQCDENINLKIKLKSKQKIQDNIYFQIQSRSDVIYAGSYNINSNQKTISIGKNDIAFGKYSAAKRTRRDSISKLLIILL